MRPKKRCSRCEKDKPVDCFRRNPDTKDKLHCWCRECCTAYKMEREAADPDSAEKRRVYQREYVTNRRKYDEEFRKRQLIYQRRYRAKKALEAAS